MHVVERTALFGGVFQGREHVRGLVGEQAILPPYHRARHRALGTQVTGIKMLDAQ